MNKGTLISMAGETIRKSKEKDFNYPIAVFIFVVVTVMVIILSLKLNDSAFKFSKMKGAKYGNKR